MKTDTATIITQENLILLAALEPQALWGNFAALCTIPRGSGNEKTIAEIIVALAKGHGATATIDADNNVLVRVPASKGKEHIPTLCLQSHLDMVIAKSPGVKKIFPIDLERVGDVLTANGSTLGADNGIGTAAMMTLITEEDLPHGPLELLFTTNEETGMDGAKKFDYSQLLSKQILNLDSEEDGVFCVGCAGAGEVIGRLSGDKIPPIPDAQAYKIKITGLTGGHSGIKIHEKRANAITMLNELLTKIHFPSYKISSIEGGEAMNAIPREAAAIIVIPKNQKDVFERGFTRVSERLRSEHINEAKLNFSLEKLNEAPLTFHENIYNNLLFLLKNLPNGVRDYEPTNSNLVRTSNNIGLIKTDEKGFVELTCMYRSSSEAQLAIMQTDIVNHFNVDGSCVAGEPFLPWEPQFDTPLLKKAIGKYITLTGSQPKVETIHAGLECAIIYHKMPNVEIISFGPTIGDAHTPQEWVNIPSVEKFWKLLLSMLED